jgi:Zn-dependent M32 family carboxypeptidase
LANSPKAKKIYDYALDKYSRGESNRNVLDDMRSALETHLKEVLNNDKSLENQFSEVGKYLQTKGLSKEFVNMVITLLDYYAKYQNNHVKHNDAVKDEEVNFIIQLTSSFIQMFV